MGHAEVKEKAEETLRPFGLREKAKARWSHSAIVRETQKGESFNRGAVQRDREKIQSERHFSLLKLHTKKINWWGSLRVFECYNYGELKCSKEDLCY